MSAVIDSADERRNVLIFATITSLIYLSAPILYVGFVQASLCKSLEASDLVANMPSAAYLAMSWTPVVVAWLYPEASVLRKTMSLSFWAMSLASAGMGLVLTARAPASASIVALVLHSGILGAANAIAFTLNWEAISRGSSDRMRGMALGLAFGWGPLFAVIGSLGAQLLLKHELLGWRPTSGTLPGAPLSYALLFFSTGATMAFAAVVCRAYRIPLPDEEPPRESFNTAVFGGFAAIARDRILFLACVAYLLMYCGNVIQNNMNIFTHEATGRSSEELAGYQLALRFSFKMVAGMCLGWLLARTNPKAPLLVIGALQIAAVLWVLMVPGLWFLLAFGLNGAAELFGVYYTNYPIACSRKERIRRNVAALMLMSSVVGFAPLLYGWISDHWGLRASFLAALLILGGTVVLVAAKLPRHPKPSEAAR